MGWFSERIPRLRDVPEAQLALKKSRNAVFFAPHSSERMATLPLISDLARKLKAEGIESVAHSVEDMRENVISLSAQLARLSLKKDERADLERLFRLKDATLRLGLICRLLDANPGAMLLEIHSLDKDYQLEDRFRWADCFYRLPGSRILVLKDFLGEYLIPIKQGLRLLETMESHKLKAAASILGLEESGVRGQSAGRLGFLGSNIGRTALIEIPAPSSGQFEGTGGMTGFEIAYGIAMSGHHTLGGDEVASLVSALI